MREIIISSSDDIIDSRDVIERIAQLEEMERAEVTGDDTDPDTWMTDEEVNELAALRALAKKVETYVDGWEDGATLIRDTYFTKYAQELAEEIYYDAMKDLRWPFTHIDWEAAAEELKVDYTELTFEGVTYYAR